MIVPHPHGGHNAVGSGNCARRGTAVRRGRVQPVTAAARGAQHPSAARRGDRQVTARNFPPAAPRHLNTARDNLSVHQRISQPSSHGRSEKLRGSARAPLPAPRAEAAPSRSPQPQPRRSPRTQHGSGVPPAAATAAGGPRGSSRRAQRRPSRGLPSPPPPTYLRAAGIHPRSGAQPGAPRAASRPPSDEDPRRISSHESTVPARPLPRGIAPTAGARRPRRGRGGHPVTGEDDPRAAPYLAPLSSQPAARLPSTAAAPSLRSPALTRRSTQPR